MARTRHMQTRMNQRAIDAEVVTVIKQYGTAQAASDGVQRRILSAKAARRAAKALDREARRLARIAEKGGYVLVENFEGVEITTYRVDSYQRPR